MKKWAQNWLISGLSRGSNHFIRGKMSPFRLGFAGLLLMAVMCTPTPATAPKLPKQLGPVVDAKGPVCRPEMVEIYVAPSGGGLLTPTLQGDAILIQEARGDVIKLEPNSGQVIWSVKSDLRTSPLGPSQIMTDGTSAAWVTRSGLLKVYSMRDGKHLRSMAEGSSEWHVIGILGDTVLLFDKRSIAILGVDWRKGQVRWVQSKESRPSLLRSSPPVLYGDRFILRTIPEANLKAKDSWSCFSLSTGALLWRIADAAEMSPALVSDGVVFCVVERQGRDVALACDALTGNELWSSKNINYRKAIDGVPAIRDGRLYMSVDYGASLVCYELKTNRESWRLDNPRPPKEWPDSAGLVIFRDCVCWFSDMTHICGVDPITGKLLWIRNCEVNWPCFGYQDELYIRDEGTLFKLFCFESAPGQKKGH